MHNITLVNTIDPARCWFIQTIINQTVMRIVVATSVAPDQPAHSRSLISV